MSKRTMTVLFDRETGTVLGIDRLAICQGSEQVIEQLSDGSLSSDQVDAICIPLPRAQIEQWASRATKARRTP